MEPKNRREFLFRLLQMGMTALAARFVVSCVAENQEDLSSFTVDVQQPDANSALCQNAPATLKWKTVGGVAGLVDIEFSPDGGTTWTSLFTNISSQAGELSWAPATEGKGVIRFVSPLSKNVLGASQPFSVQKSGITLLSPKAGDVWYSGDPVEIKWEAHCSGPLQLEYTKDNGAKWVSIASGIPETQTSFTWTPPLDQSFRMGVRLTGGGASPLSAQVVGGISLVPQVEIDVKKYPNLQQDGGMQVLEFPYFGLVGVVRENAAAYIVLDMICTHQGCQVEVRGNGEGWRCPCHGAEFEKKGCILSGDATEPIYMLENTFDQARGIIKVRLVRKANAGC